MKKLMYFGGWVVPRRVFVALVIAAVAELVEMTLNVRGLAIVGFVVIPWSALPCVVAAAMIVHYPHRKRIVINEPRALAYVSLLISTLVFASIYVVDNGFGVTLAIFAAVSIEEIVYRFTLPVLLSLLAIKLGVRAHYALLLGIGLSIALFAAMPGHVVQLHDLRSWMAFVAFSILMSHAVWRGRSLFAPIVAHAVYDYATIGMNNGDIPSLLRVAGAATALLALIVIAAHPKIRVIDLREPEAQPEVDVTDARKTSLLPRI